MRRFQKISSAIAILGIGLSLVFSDAVFAKIAASDDEKNSVQSPHAYVYENYDKQEYNIPMRDGTMLYTQVYTPKDTSTTYPILLVRTPYRAIFHQGGKEGYFGLLGPGQGFIQEGYIFVVQDVRGRYLSEGDFEVMRPNSADWDDPTKPDESTDAWDTIDWLVNNIENHNGKVGTHGVSYPGHYSAQALVNAHPALTVALVEAPVAETFLGDDYGHNGALQLLYPFMWMNNIGLAKRDGPSNDMQRPLCGKFEENYYQTFLKMGPVSNLNKICFQNKAAMWNKILEHETYDEFWQERSLGQYLTGIEKPVVLVVGSWFDDQDLYGTLHTYNAIENQNPDATNTLIMGPWNHAKWWDQKKEPWGKAKLPVKEMGNYYREKILLPFFNFHLKGKKEIQLPEVMSFDTGSRVWKEFSAWPANNTQTKEIYFGAEGKLLNQQPSNNPEKFAEFISDPANPVPQIPSERIWGWTSEVMQYDQTFASLRDDVLVYNGEVLEKDMTVAGPIDVELYVSTTGTDADWVVKVIDVYPNGESEQANYQMLIRGDILRGKFRDSFENPTPFIPGEITKVRFSLPDIHHTFKKGHRLMVQVQSSWFPMFDRNPQIFMNIREAKEEDFQPATHRIYHSKKHPSKISMKVLPAKQPNN